MKHLAMLSRSLPALSALLLLFPGSPSWAGLGAVERVHDFGLVGIDYDLYHTFKLWNAGQEPVYVDSVRINCDCSQAFLLDSVVAPGDTGRIRVKFNTRNFYGPTSRAVRVYWRGPQEGKTELFYKAVVGQWYYGLKPNPQSLFFLPKATEKSVSIFNPQLKEISVAEVFTPDTFVTIQTVADKAKKGKALRFVVKPAPNLPKGTYTSSVTIKLDLPLDLEPVNISLPVKVVRY